MHNNKESQKEILKIEAVVWAGWTVLFGFIYLIAKLLS